MFAGRTFRLTATGMPAILPLENAREVTMWFQKKSPEELLASAERRIVCPGQDKR